nr:probable G-protein coupled receptor 150 [Anolis sagrei ordinatus]
MTEPEGLSWPEPTAKEQPGNLSSASAAPFWATVAHPAWVSTAAAILLLALLGNGLLLHRLRCCCGCQREQRRKKADFLLAHLAVADLCCAGLLLGPQLAPSNPATSSDAAASRLLRVLQGWGLLAPSNMLVLIAFERCGPSARRFPRAASAWLGWLLALLLALPQASAFPPGRAYAAYWALAGFVAPAGLLGAACARILCSLRASPEEEEEEEEEDAAASPARSPPWFLRFLPGAKPSSSSSAPSSPRSLPRARTRALHLALALSALFALCGLPRFALELAEGPPAAFGSLLAAANAALNPFACLLFRSHRPWARSLQRSLCRCPEGPLPRRRARRQAPPPHTQAPPRPLCPCQQHPPPHALAEPFEA